MSDLAVPVVAKSQDMPQSRLPFWVSILLASLVAALLCLAIELAFERRMIALYNWRTAGRALLTAVLTGWLHFMKGERKRLIMTGRR